MPANPKIVFAIFCALVFSACSSGSSNDPMVDPAIEGAAVQTSGDLPGLATWESNMQAFGRKYCDAAQINSLSTWEGSVWYYDGIRVYYQIFDYTGDPFWKNCAEYVKAVYRRYVLDADGRVGAWRVFPHGLYRDFQLTGDDDSRKAVLLLANNSPFADQGGGAGVEMSRETAYLIHAYLAAEKLEPPPHPNLGLAVAYALGHIDQWFISQNAEYINPFMAGLTMEALIAYHEEKPDPRIPLAVKAAADWLWDNAWNNTTRSFEYVLCPNGNSSPKCKEAEGQSVDLNLLIAPAYAWLYKTTGDPKYRERGDQIFLAGASGAWLGNGKQFSQNYRWSFDYVKWRG